MIYSILAPFYDEFNDSVDYSVWADFIERTVDREYGKSPEIILDLGSGTGKMTLELAKRGYEMIGIDYSPEMLDVARENADLCGVSDKTLWLCQDMTDFELYGTVDVALCCLDGLNHLTKKNDLDKCLSLVHNYLCPDGLFIFDINGKYKFEHIYADRSYAYEIDGNVCIWQNYYNEKTKLCDFYITLFSENDDGSYERYDESQRERMYTVRSMTSALRKSGFEIVGAYSDFEGTAATDASERIYFVARCKKEN